MNIRLLLPKLQHLVRQQIKDRNLQFKVKIQVIMQTLSKVLKSLILTKEDTESTSWECFEKLLRDKGWFRTLLKQTLLEEEKQALVDCLSSDTEEQSSSSQSILGQNTAATTTSSMIAPIITPTVPALECPSSINDENPLEMLFGQVALPALGSSIQQSISLRLQDKLFTAKSEGEIGHEVIK